MGECPKCSAELPDPEPTECVSCGVILAKAVSPEFAEQQRRYRSLKSHSRGHDAIDGGAMISVKNALLVGTGVAFAIYLFPFTRFVLSYLAILIHELGHTVVGTLFGYPSFPSFDFLYGGGVTLYFGRSTALLVLIALAWLAVLWWLRHWPKLLALAGVAAAIWLASAVTGFHDFFLNASGHGAELLFAGWCYFKVLSGNVRSGTERWLYAMCASFLVLSAWMFAIRLVESEVARRQYGQAKGGGHWMDMSRIAHSLDMELVPIALLYWLAATLLPAAICLVWINRAGIRRSMTS